MKTPEELQAAIDEIAAICRKHRIVLVGTCSMEGICGEISVFEVDNPGTAWKDVDKYPAAMNRVIMLNGGGPESAPYVFKISEWCP